MGHFDLLLHDSTVDTIQSNMGTVGLSGDEPSCNQNTT